MQAQTECKEAIDDGLRKGMGKMEETALEMVPYFAPKTVPLRWKRA